MTYTKKVYTALISGAGIGGLTLAIQLKKMGWQPAVVELAKGPSTGGYTMDIFGTGWDALKRIGILDKVLALPRTISSVEVHDPYVGKYARLELKDLASVVKNYTYVRRSDLEKILHDEAVACGIPIYYDRHIETIKNSKDESIVTISDGKQFTVNLVVGADGLHSRVRELVFGEPQQYTRHLGMYVAGFEVNNNNYAASGAFAIMEAKTYQMTCYPGLNDKLNILFALRSPELPRLSPEAIVSFVGATIKNEAPIGQKILNDPSLSSPVYFSPVTQIIMPRWHKNDVVLIGDACGCLTFMSGQGSHMALAGAYVLANELAKYPDDIAVALAKYQSFMQPHIRKKQKQTRRLTNVLVPHAKSNPWLRRFIVKLVFFLASRKILSKLGSSRSVLKNYR